MNLNKMTILVDEKKVDILSFYSAQNNNWDWKFEVCLFLHPTLSSALDIMCYCVINKSQQYRSSSVYVVMNYITLFAN